MYGVSGYLMKFVVYFCLGYEPIILMAMKFLSRMMKMRCIKSMLT